MSSLDLKDRRIIYLLNENVRLTSNKIAQTINSSREVVEYRIKKLHKAGLIKDYLTLVNISQLGYDNYLMLIELQNYSPQTETEIITKIKQHPFTKWLIKSSGNWDLHLVLTAKNKRQLAQIVDEITLICGGHLRKYDLAINIAFLKQEDLSFLIPEGINYTKKKTSPPKKLSLDQKDFHLLENITTNSNFRLIELAQKINMSVDATKARLKKLEKHGIITKYQTVIDLSKLNYLVYYLFIKFNTFDKNKESRLKTFFQNQKNVAFVERILGQWDVRIEIICKDTHEYQQTLYKIREFFSTELKYYNSSLLLQEHKRKTYSPEMK